MKPDQDQLDARARWRAAKLAEGLCSNCGQRPVAVGRLGPKTRCRECLDKRAAQQYERAKHRHAPAQEKP